MVFIDIDTQYDFMNSDGSLYVTDAETIKEKLKKLTESAVRNDIPVNSTLDTHTNDEPEFEDFLKRYIDHQMIVYGVATDYCVKSSSLGLLKRGYRLVLVENAIKGKQACWN